MCRCWGFQGENEEQLQGEEGGREGREGEEGISIVKGLVQCTWPLMVKLDEKLDKKVKVHIKEMLGFDLHVF